MIRFIIFFLCIFLSNHVLACERTSIIQPSPFMGNSGEVFELSNGSIWRVMGSYEYMYAYSPRAIVCADQGLMIVDGKEINIMPVSSMRPTVQPSPKSTGVIRSNIDGDFDGYDFGRIYPLINGQIWRQISPDISIAVRINPSVMIIPDGNQWIMMVDGESRQVTVEPVQ